jgi:hypothetical protein
MNLASNTGTNDTENKSSKEWITYRITWSIYGGAKDSMRFYVHDENTKQKFEHVYHALNEYAKKYGYPEPTVTKEIEVPVSVN